MSVDKYSVNPDKLDEHKFVETDNGLVSICQSCFTDFYYIPSTVPLLSSL